VKSVISGFSSGVSICRNKGPQSDLGAPFSPGSPQPGGTGGPSSGSAAMLSFWILRKYSLFTAENHDILIHK